MTTTTTAKPKATAKATRTVKPKPEQTTVVGESGTTEAVTDLAKLYRSPDAIKAETTRLVADHKAASFERTRHEMTVVVLAKRGYIPNASTQVAIAELLDCSEPQVSKIWKIVRQAESFAPVAKLADPNVPTSAEKTLETVGKTIGEVAASLAARDPKMNALAVGVDTLFGRLGLGKTGRKPKPEQKPDQPHDDPAAALAAALAAAKAAGLSKSAAAILVAKVYAD